MIPLKDIDDFFASLKKFMREAKVTYKDVAKHLDLSEASVKRMFSKQDISMRRLGEILILLQLDLHDVTERMAREKAFTSELTPEQEQQLMDNPKLLMVLFLLLNSWPLDLIQAEFMVTEHELTNMLAVLDRLKLIELLPNNRVKLLTARHFTWCKRGPVQRYIIDNLLKDFLASSFTGKQENLRMVGGRLSEQSYQKAENLLSEFVKEFDSLIFEDQNTPFEDKKSFGAAIALRPWEYKVFTSFRR